MSSRMLIRSNPLSMKKLGVFISTLMFAVSCSSGEAVDPQAAAQL